MKYVIYPAAAAAILIVLFAIRIVRENAEHRKKTESKIKNSWGAKSSQLFSADYMQKIRTWSNGISVYYEGTDRKTKCSEIDEITANDLELDRVFESIDHTVSEPGREVLYGWLRHPLTDCTAYEERMRLIRCFETDEKTRNEVRMILAEIGHSRNGSYAEDILRLKEAQPIGKMKYLVLTVLTLAGFAGLFLMPLLALILLVPVLFLDFRIHLKMRKCTAPYLRGFKALIAIIEASEKLSSFSIPGAEEISRTMIEARKSFGGFKRSSYFVLSSGNVSTGFSESVLEYLNVFFHFDLLAFDGMLEKCRNHEREALTLFEGIGSLDAALSAASYKASRELICEAHMTGSNERAFSCEGLVHPLLEGARENSIDTDGAILLTGSNASGKSTFLKSCALAALFAQSMGICCARQYRAPFFRIMTSMALSDNLKGGESYYAVEIRSLKRIADAAESGDVPVLTMIDEVLRGTNTIERIAASAQILMMLKKKGVLVFAATHDIELTYMLEEEFSNYHFGETAADGDVHFDYCLQHGRSTGRNAIRLLETAGYDRTAVKAAYETAAHFEETGEWKL